MDKRRSKLWRFFTQANDDDDKAKCDICNSLYSLKGGSTTNLKKHLIKKHRSAYENIIPCSVSDEAVPVLEAPIPLTSPFTESINPEGAGEAYTENPLEDDKTQVMAHTAFYSLEGTPMQSTSNAQSPRRAKRSLEKRDFLLETIEHYLKKPKKIDDRHDIFGKNVAVKMRDIKNETQRLLVEKIINDAIFMAEMGQLNMSHSIRDH